MKELDKAAKAYEKEMYGYTVKKTIVDTDCSNEQNIIDIHEAFKAGAKWFASLGETLEGYEVVGEEGWCEHPVPVLNISVEDFKFGEEVVVQIRKKGQIL